MSGGRQHNDFGLRPPGPTGARGSITWTGNGAPGTIAGQADNDLYLNQLNADLYKLVSGAWGVIANLKGISGAQGAKGTGFLTLATADAVPASTPAGTVIVRS